MKIGKTRSMTIESQEVGYVITFGAMEPGRMKEWYAFSSKSEALAFIEHFLAGADAEEIKRDYD